MQIGLQTALFPSNLEAISYIYGMIMVLSAPGVTVYIENYKLITSNTKSESILHSVSWQL